jgi:hypothetical protein
MSYVRRCNHFLLCKVTLETSLVFPKEASLKAKSQARLFCEYLTPKKCPNVLSSAKGFRVKGLGFYKKKSFFSWDNPGKSEK